MYIWSLFEGELPQGSCDGGERLAAAVLPCIAMLISGTTTASAAGQRGRRY